MNGNTFSACVHASLSLIASLLAFALQSCLREACRLSERVHTLTGVVSLTYPRYQPRGYLTCEFRNSNSIVIFNVIMYIFMNAIIRTALPILKRLDTMSLQHSSLLAKEFVLNPLESVFVRTVLVKTS